MSVDQVEAMSTILIGCGAKRIAKDLVNIIKFTFFKLTNFYSSITITIYIININIFKCIQSN